MVNIERQILKKYSGQGLFSAVETDATLSEIFHENTKLTPLSGRAYGENLNRVSHSPAARRLLDGPQKIYSLQDQVELASAHAEGVLEKVIAGRSSVRSYTGEAVRFDELSRLLFFSYGRTGANHRYRAVASGGALYPLELYVVARRVEGLVPGLYHYDAEGHRLDVLERRDRWEDIQDCVWFQTIDVDSAAMLLVVTAIFRRMTLKYQDRGYRMILMEAGEVAQNVSLLSTAMGLGACLLGGFLDDALSKVVGVDGVNEAPLLPIVLGRSNERGEETAAGGDW